MALSRPTPLLSAALAACALASACGDSQPKATVLGRAQSPIVGGTPDGDTGTVLITHLDYGFLCSGTVIAPSLVLTAKHCVLFPQNGADVPLPGNRFEIGFGASQTSLSSVILSKKVEWVGSPGNTDVQTAVDGGYDVALIYLSQGVPSGTTVHQVDFGYQPADSDPITIVGYGMNAANGGGYPGVKLMTTDSVVAWTLSGIISTQGKGACNGDSGGSFFHGPNRDLVAVTSTAGASAQGKACDVGITNGDSMQNAQAHKFVFDALQAVGSCSPVQEICGNGIDDDCDGITDDHCSFNGAACTLDSDCKTNLCRPIGGQSVCVRPCDADNPCGASQHCQNECSGGFCADGVQGQASLGDACTDGSQCGTHNCGPGGTCAIECDSTKGQCPDGYACSVAAGCGSCRPVAEVPGQRSLGEGCNSSADCATGAGCVDDGFGVLRCAEPCVEGACAKGFVCEDAKCVRGGKLGVGERCRGPEDCESATCAVRSGWDNYCTVPCAADQDCGASGFSCTDVGGGALYCTPQATDLGKPCAADTECVSGFCSTSLGACSLSCDPVKAPCPPGFLCEVADGSLYCKAGPGAYPPPPDAGAAGAGGSDAGEPPDAAAAGAAGAPPAADADSGSSGGCAVASRSAGAGAGWLGLALGLGLVRRRRRR